MLQEESVSDCRRTKTCYCTSWPGNIKLHGKRFHISLSLERPLKQFLPQQNHPLCRLICAFCEFSCLGWTCSSEPTPVTGDSFFYAFTRTTGTWPGSKIILITMREVSLRDEKLHYLNWLGFIWVTREGEAGIESFESVNHSYWATEWLSQSQSSLTAGRGRWSSNETPELLLGCCAIYESISVEI